MLKKNEKGISGIDIVISIILITIFITLIGNLIININMNVANSKRKTKAVSYAVQEIEKIKARGYIYDNKGINQEEILEECDITNEQNEFTGFHKKIFVNDYVNLTGNEGKKENLVKIVTAEVSYNLYGKKQKVTLTTYISKE